MLTFPSAPKRSDIFSFQPGGNSAPEAVLAGPAGLAADARKVPDSAMAKQAAMNGGNRNDRFPITVIPKSA